MSGSSGRSGATGSTGRASAAPPPFLSKLLAMLTSAECQPYISWSSGGQYIVLRNAEELGAKIIPKFFRHNKFSSYLRQVRAPARLAGRGNCTLPRHLRSCTSTASGR